MSWEEEANTRSQLKSALSDLRRIPRTVPVVVEEDDTAHNHDVYHVRSSINSALLASSRRDAGNNQASKARRSSQGGDIAALLQQLSSMSPCYKKAEVCCMWYSLPTAHGMCAACMSDYRLLPPLTNCHVMHSALPV